MKVSKLKQYLQNAIDELDEFNDDDQVHMVTNTYFLNSSNFIGTHEGYVDLDNIRVDDSDDDDEEENEEA